MAINKRCLPCGCCPSWDPGDVVFALCNEHSVEYESWKKNTKESSGDQKYDKCKRSIYEYDDEDDSDSDEFVKMITARQKMELKSFDNKILTEMQ